MRTRKYLWIILIIGIGFTMWQCDQAKDKKAEQKSETEKQADPKSEREKPEVVHDDNGNIIERHAISYRKSDNSVRSKDSYFYEYDENNNLIRETKESYAPSGELKFKNVNVFTYNDLNQKIEQNFYSYDANDVLQRKARNTFKYNQRGHKIEDISFYDDGSVKARIILEPDENGVLLSEEYINYSHDESETDHKKYYYNEFGLERTEDLMDKNK